MALPRYLALIGGDPESLEETWIEAISSRRQLHDCLQRHDARGQGTEVLMLYRLYSEAGEYVPVVDPAEWGRW